MKNTLMIFPSKLKHRFSLITPPSKSHTMRALLLASLAQGTSIIKNYLKSYDTLAMIKIIKANGCSIDINKDTLKIVGNKKQWEENPCSYINAENSGQIFRFYTSQAARSSYPITITGDDSIKNNRPIKPLLEALSKLNCSIKHLSSSLVPFQISGPIQPGITTLCGQDSQLISSLLMTLPFLNKPSIINVIDPGEKPWIDLTLYWLKKIGANISHNNYKQYNISENLSYPGFSTLIPSDFSSMAFLIAIGIINNIDLEIQNVDFDDVQGDKKIIDILISMGANIEKDFVNKSLKIYPSLKNLKGISINVNQCIDAIPILAVISCFAEGTTKIYNGAISRFKESNRLKAITQELRKMNADIRETKDGLIIRTSHLKSSQALFSHNDHRIAMSLIVATLTLFEPSSIFNISCINKSFPEFTKIISSLGGNVKIC